MLPHPRVCRPPGDSQGGDRRGAPGQPARLGSSLAGIGGCALAGAPGTIAELRTSVALKEHLKRGRGAREAGIQCELRGLGFLVWRGVGLCGWRAGEMSDCLGHHRVVAGFSRYIASSTVVRQIEWLCMPMQEGAEEDACGLVLGIELAGQTRERCSADPTGEGAWGDRLPSR